MDSSTPFGDRHSIFVLIATRGRFDLLSNRALPSVLAQSRLPDRLLIVIDQDKDELPDRAFAERSAAIHAECQLRVPAAVLRNRRTPRRAAGAWNTGIDEIHRDATIMERPDRCFLAVLDDDDAWAPDHLEKCLEEAVKNDRTMVVAGLVRCESIADPGRLQAIPASLDAREQFIRGQHIQGSNLFVRFDLMLRVGGFDEHLPSCTDRDLCIRLSDVGALRFGRVGEHTVRHFADPRPDRLSAPASRAKLDGLTRFWHKYADRFDDVARAEAAARALSLFGWTLPEDTAVRHEIPPLVQPSRPVAMVVGFVTDARVPAHVPGLLDDLARLASQPGVDWLHVVVVENGPLPPEPERSLRELVASCCISSRLDIELVTIERQREDWRHGRLVSAPDPSLQRLPIAVSRTILNTYVARAAMSRPGAMAWILDDDKKLSIRLDRGDGSTVERPSPDLASLCALRDAGVDVVIGPDTDAAPLPFVATLRVQLIDLNHALQILAASSPLDRWPDRAARAALERALMPDSYYDLSRSTEHLETPFTVAREAGGDTAGDVLAFIASKVERLLAGEAVFRPLTVRVDALSASAAKSSTQRGGSTIFFHPAHLLAFPQSIARFGELYVRRSDMLVSQLMRDQLGLTIVAHPAAGVRHDRSSTARATFSDETLREDVLGYALYRTANEVMLQRPAFARRAPLLAWSDRELVEAVRKVRKYITERLASLTLNAWRILGLAEGARATISSRMIGASRWSSDAAREQLARIDMELSRICEQFRPSAVQGAADRIRTAVSDSEIRATFTSMDALIHEYRSAHRGPTESSSDVDEARVLRARASLEGAYNVSSLRLLGMGGEGVVFTDGQQVYKVLDLLKERPNHDTWATLKAFSERVRRARHLYPLTSLERKGATLVLTYPYEPSEPYTGGRGAELIGLLRECKESGIVCRNVHPKNLRVSRTGLKLVDYGSDIRPYSEAGYRSMAQRAWLTWRLAGHSDLDERMRRALTEPSLPDLDGFERFWRALVDVSPSATPIVASIVDPILLDSSAKRVLDYGCGKQARSARRLAENGLSVVGFDPGEGLSERWQRLGALPNGLTLTRSREVALSGAPYDAVLCSLVLCEIEDGPVYASVLRDLRRAVGDAGRAIITVCNPFSTFGGPTSLHRRRILPDGVTYEDRFSYAEDVESSSGRPEFHRPLSQLERDLLRAGFSVESRTESEAVDLERFEPASDFLTLVCRPIVVERPERRVSLVIKTCAMEASTIERLVGHLVGQLEGPRAFHERILAIDPRRGEFLRQYTAGDIDAVQRAGERLVRRGLIDRVTLGPPVGPEARRINREWFGLDSDSTHTAAGAPLSTPLSAFEACAGEYVLQVDSDLLIGRPERDHDYLGEMMAALEADSSAVTISLCAPGDGPQPLSACDRGQPWRVEVRGCLLHKARLFSARPFPNESRDGAPIFAWHRSLDHAARTGRVTSLRGGSRRSYFVHPPNELKRSTADWMLLLDFIEKGAMLQEQHGKVDWVGDVRDWAPRGRAEPVVFLVTGRDVPPGRALRCLASLAAQERRDWGAVVIDDGSGAWSRDYLPIALAALGPRVTLIQSRERRGQLANMVLAIRHVCTNPESVIVTLDLDDALLGSGVVGRVASEHARGADVTVGSMLRTDKKAHYPVSFDDPRRARGGNVWQHLRSFRKRLFDAVPDHHLRIDGRYVDIAVDWAFMIPIVELAEKPAWIQDVLYLYEPSGMGKGDGRPERERQIAAIVAKPSLRSAPRSPLDSAKRPSLRVDELPGLCAADELDEVAANAGEDRAFMSGEVER